MKRRWLVRLGLAGMLGLAGSALYLWLASGSGGINRMTVLRIKAGQSREEVEAIVGVSHGNHRSDSDEEARPLSTRLLALYIHGRGEACFWHGDEGTITVWFDDEGK